jgi:hypothetical protein
MNGRIISAVALSLILSFSISLPTATRSAHTGTDYINFQASIEGHDYDSDGKKEWCWTYPVGWNPAYIYWHMSTGGHMNAMDQQPQLSAGAPGCQPVFEEPVVVAQHGWTSSSSCSGACPSLHVWEIDYTQPNGCDLIDISTYDWVYRNWWKGSLKLYHAANPGATGENLAFNVSNSVVYQEIPVGKLTYDIDCGDCDGCDGSWDGYHVHQEWVPAASCWWARNDAIGSPYNHERPNTSQWIQKSSHRFLHPC